MSAFVRPVAITLFFLGTLAFGFFFQERLISIKNASAIPPVAIFGSPIPSDAEVSLALKTDDGALGRLIFPNFGVRVDTITAPAPSIQKPLPNDILEELKAIKVQKKDSTISRSVSSYFNGQFDPLRTKVTARIEIPVGDTHIPAIRIETKDHEQFVLAVGTKQGVQAGLLILQSQQVMAEQALGEILSKLPALKTILAL
jgi:hypothetical protein